MAIFKEIEKEKIQKLIMLYERYLTYGTIGSLRAIAEEVSFDSGYGVFSKVVNIAAGKLDEALNSKMPESEAERLLTKLKNLLKEEV